MRSEANFEGIVGQGSALRQVLPQWTNGAPAPRRQEPARWTSNRPLCVSWEKPKSWWVARTAPRPAHTRILSRIREFMSGSHLVLDEPSHYGEQHAHGQPGHQHA